MNDEIEDDQSWLNLWRAFLLDTFVHPYNRLNGKSRLDWDKVYASLT